jgi:hypothetical protein
MATVDFSDYFWVSLDLNLSRRQKLGNKKMQKVYKKTRFKSCQNNILKTFFTIFKIGFQDWFLVLQQFKLYIFRASEMKASMFCIRI